MTESISLILETTVNTLLQVGARVFEISREHVITNSWHKGPAALYGSDPTGKNAKDFWDTSVDKQIAASFRTGENKSIEYIKADDGAQLRIGLRILPIHPDKDYLFVLEEPRIKQRIEDIVEDKWKLALDATGDGMWEFNLETDKMSFSEKWHTTFGYSCDEITTGTEWANKLHPDDLIESREAVRRYLAGETATYSSELRYLYKDGEYRWIQSRGVVISQDSEGLPLRSIGTHTDINARKLTEEKLSSLAQLLSKLINNLRDGIMVSDEHRKIVFANQTFCDLYNVTEEQGSLVGADIDRTIASRAAVYADPELFLEKTMASLEKKAIVLNEEWLLKDGRTVSRDFIPLVLGTNNKGGIWKLRDITEQKTIEKRLLELRNFYEEILNSIGGDIVVFDAQRRYIFINPSAIKNPELRTWMIGKTDEDYARMRNKPLDMVERRRDIFETARDERRTVEWEERLERPDGKIEYHLRNNFPVFDADGNHVMSIGYGLNITDRKLKEEELRTSKETFASAFDLSGVGMALISMDRRWLDVNNKLCSMTGYTKEELKQLSLKDITYPDDRDNDNDLARKLLKGELQNYTIERRYISKQNKIVLVQLTISLVRTNEGSPDFLIAQAVDITEKKALEKELTQKNTELEATKVNLINKIAQLEQLSHIIAHNLRGPAGNIKMLSGALLAKNKGGKNAVENMLSDAFTENEVLSLIQDSSTLLMESLSTLMAITEIKLNKEIPYNECDVAAIVKDITSQLHTTIFEKNALIHLELEVPVISYPKAYLENILYNLVSNALKYSLEDTPPEITITTKLSKTGRVQIIVKDNGMGIDMNKYGDKVFKLNEVFHQGYDSKGVGLYITKTQVESFGGTIALESKINEGCEFTVTL